MMDKDIVKAIQNWCNGRFTKKKDTAALDDKITAQNADFAQSLDQINSDLKSKIIVKEFEYNNIKWSAGEIGTRITQFQESEIVPDGYSFIGVFVSYIKNSQLAFPVPMTAFSNLYVNLYRTTKNENQEDNLFFFKIRVVIAKL